MTPYWIHQHLQSIVCIWLLTQQAETLLLTKCILSLPQTAFPYQREVIPVHVKKKHKWAINQRPFETKNISNQLTQSPNFRICMSKPASGCTFEQVQQRAFTLSSTVLSPSVTCNLSRNNRSNSAMSLPNKRKSHPLHNISSSQGNKQLIKKCCSLPFLQPQAVVYAYHSAVRQMFTDGIWWQTWKCVLWSSETNLMHFGKYIYFDRPTWSGSNLPWQTLYLTNVLN